MILIAGYCMVPIIGTLNSGVSNTQAYELRAMMQNLAESKLNELTSKAVFLGEQIADSTETVPFPNTTDAYFHLVITVEVKNPVSVTAQYDPGHPLAGAQNQNLKSVSVKVALQEAEPAVEPVTLTTLLDRPPLPGDKLYAAVPAQKLIYVINPKTHQQEDVFDLTASGHTPVHLAVHPNGEWLAIKDPRRVLLMDIRSNSSSRGQMTEVYDGGAANSVCGSSNASDDTSDSTYTRSDRGLVFRTDGKILYFTTHTSPAIIGLEVPTLPSPGSLPGSSWSPPTGFPTVTIGADSLDFELTEDGRLITCEHTGNHKVIHTHTHSAQTDFMPPWPANTGKLSHHRAVASSHDGNDLAFLYCGGSPNNYLGLVAGKSPTLLNDTLMVNTGVSGSDHYMDDLLFSRDDRWLFTCSSDPGQGKHIYAFSRTPGEFWSGSFFSWDVNSAANRFYNTGNAEGITTLKPSPYGKEIIADSKGSTVFFLNVKNLADSTGTICEQWIAPSSGLVSDVSGRIAEQIWIPCDGGAGKYTVECLDLFGGDGGKIDENKRISLSAAPKHATLTSGGDKLSLAVSGSWAPYEGDGFDFSATAMGVTVPTDANTEKLDKTIWLLDRSLITLNSRPGCSSHWGSFPGELSATGDCHNGFLLYKSDDKGDLVAAPVVGFGTKGAEGWRVKDAVAMHRRNGAYVLFNNSATDDSMLFWLEKSKSGGYSGTEDTDEYKIMHVWQKRFDGFPEGKPSRIALSPDDTTLVLYDPNAAGNQKLRVYDLNNQHFPVPTGVVIHAFNSNAGDFSSTPAQTPLNLKKALWRFNTTSNHNVNYPFNRYDGNTAGDGYNDTTRRYFGTWHQPGQVKVLGLMSYDAIRWFLGENYPSPSYTNGALWTETGSDYFYKFDNSGGGIFSLTAGPVFFQGETFHDSTGETEREGFGWVSDTGIADPNSCDQSTAGNPQIKLKSGGSYWNYPKVKEFRAFRFRPPLLKEIALDGTAPWPNKTSADGDSLFLAFHRDTSFPYLLIADQTGGKVYALDLFPVSAKFSITSGISGTIQDLRESPDGRRLIIATKNPDQVYLYDISYALPFGTIPSISLNTPKILDLPGDPVGIAVRPFSSFASRPNTYREVFDPSALSPDGSNYVARYGKNTCTLGNGGIYIVAGANGHDSGYTKKAVRFNPVEKQLYSLVDVPAPQANQSVFGLDNRIFSISGYNGAPVPSIFVYEPAITTGEWLHSTSATKNYDEFRNNGNTAIGGDHNAACLTPYGPVVFLGHAGTGVETAAFYPDARMNTGSPPLFGETLALPSSISHFDASAVCHYSRKDKKWYLFRVGGGTSGDTAINELIQRFDFDANSWGAGVNIGFKRVSHTACSFGDEILIFGGHDGSSKIDAYAYNPDSGKTRSLAVLPSASTFSTVTAPDAATAKPCGMGVAVCGPYVYLIDGATSATAGNDGAKVIRVYCP